MKALPQTALEAVAVVTVGVLLGLGANALSPRGLSLTRNYFPDLGSLAPAPGTTNLSAGNVSNTTSPGATGQVAQIGSPAPTNAATVTVSPDAPSLIGFDETLALYQDPRREAELILFVDARNQSEYEAGHIPGSHRFDHYRPEEGLAEVLPLCQAAELVVVYCNGGDCEDSRLTAHTLRELGVPAAHLRVYEGGLAEWRARGQPVETGPRLSGMLLPPDQP